ncbi:MAG: nucleotidyltransferase domain-containing protein [bacterium]|nr:nucleotidyltransferase domain-containing protein [bacterium]
MERRTEDEIVDNFTGRLIRDFEPGIRKIILFGSRAKGIAAPYSDYDLLLVLKERDRRLIDQIYDLVTDFLLDYGADISLKIYSEKDFEKKLVMRTPFIMEVTKTGRLLWTKQ